MRGINHGQLVCNGTCLVTQGRNDTHLSAVDVVGVHVLELQLVHSLCASGLGNCASEPFENRSHVATSVLQEGPSSQPPATTKL